MTIQSVIEKCKALKLKTFAENLEQTIAIGEQKNWTLSFKPLIIFLILNWNKEEKTRSKGVLSNQNYMKNRPSISSTLIFTVHVKIKKIEF